MRTISWRLIAVPLINLLDERTMPRNHFPAYGGTLENSKRSRTCLGRSRDACRNPRQVQRCPLSPPDMLAPATTRLSRLPELVDVSEFQSEVLCSRHFEMLIILL